MTTTLTATARTSSLADLVGDFEPALAIDVRSWYGTSGRRSPSCSASPSSSPRRPRACRSDDPIGAMTRRPASPRSSIAARRGRPGVSDAQARVQLAVIQASTAAGRERGELWRVTRRPDDAADGRLLQRRPQSLRAFYPDTAPGYFGDGWEGPPPRAASACGWQTPLVLHLGTFPWVYSSRLDGAAPACGGSRRRRSRRSRACALAVSLMEPATNLRQDARQVAAIYQHFATHTAPLVARLPVFQPGRAEAGACTAATASCTSTRAASTSPASTARAAGSPPLPTITSCAASRASSRSAARRSATCHPARRRPASCPQLGRPVPAPARRGGGPCSLNAGRRRDRAGLPYLHVQAHHPHPPPVHPRRASAARTTSRPAKFGEPCGGRVGARLCRRSQCESVLRAACEGDSDCPPIEGYRHECLPEGVCTSSATRTTSLACPQTLGTPMKCGVRLCERAS
jgi:hypothetical protein